MYELDAIYSCYQNYDIKTMDLKKNSPPMAGLFGFGKGPKDDPCHEAFYKDVERLVGEFLAMNPSQEEIMQAATFMISYPVGREQNKLGIMFMLAAQRHTLPLIEHLSADQCGELKDLFDAHFPRRQRLPIQDQIYKELKTREKAGQ